MKIHQLFPMRRRPALKRCESCGMLADRDSTLWRWKRDYRNPHEPWKRHDCTKAFGAAVLTVVDGHGVDRFC